MLPSNTARKKRKMLALDPHEVLMVTLHLPLVVGKNAPYGSPIGAAWIVRNDALVLSDMHLLKAHVGAVIVGF